MIESAREIFKRPAEVAARLALAGGLILTTACGASGQEKLKCPSTVVGVANLVGGDPRNWKPIEGLDGSWSFKSDDPQRLNGAAIGRVDTAEYGRISTGSVPATQAWYTCLDRSNATLENSQPTPTSTPSS